MKSILTQIKLVAFALVLILVGAPLKASINSTSMDDQYLAANDVQQDNRYKRKSAPTHQAVIAVPDKKTTIVTRYVVDGDSVIVKSSESIVESGDKVYKQPEKSTKPAVVSSDNRTQQEGGFRRKSAPTDEAVIAVPDKKTTVVTRYVVEGDSLIVKSSESIVESGQETYEKAKSSENKEGKSVIIMPKRGKAVAGVVTEDKPGNSLIIKLSDGTYMLYEYKDIETVVDL